MPGFDKPKSVLMLYIAYITLALIVVGFSGLMLFCNKEMELEFWPVKAEKVQDPKAVEEFNKWLATK